MMFCTRPTMASLPAAFFTMSKTCLPSTPPQAPPRANVNVLRSSFSSFLLLRRETTVIVSTVVPLKKLISEVVMGKMASITGLMRTPPPIPLMEPTMVAIRTTTAKSERSMDLFLKYFNYMVTLILWLLSVKEKMDVKPYLIPFEEDWMKIYSFSIRDCSLLTGKMCWKSAENQSRYFFFFFTHHRLYDT